MDSEAGERTVAGCLGADGAGIGFGCGWGADYRGEEGGHVGAEWGEDFYHQWRPRELRGRACRDRSGERDEGNFSVRGGEGDEGFQAGQEREQAGTAGERYVGADLRGL